MKKRKITAIGTICVFLFAGTLAVSACEYEGFTPGFWKNNQDLWESYSPGDIIEDVFTLSDGTTFPESIPGITDATLITALNFGGGKGFEGKARNLLRAGVAALLNAAHPDVDYRYGEEQVKVLIISAFWYGDPDYFDTLKEDFDCWNNMGGEI